MSTSPRTKKHLKKWKTKSKIVRASKIESLERLAKKLLDKPELLPPCQDLFKSDAASKKYPITFELEKGVEEAALGKGDAVIFLGYLVQKQLKIPVALKLAFVSNQDPPEEGEIDQRDNSGEIEFSILFKIRNIILSHESPNFIMPLAFRECNLEEILAEKGVDQKFEQQIFPLYQSLENSPAFDRSDIVITIMERGKQTLYKLLPQVIDQMDTFEEFQSKFLDPMLFQIGNAFHVLVSHGIVHHDAHMNNIFVDFIKGNKFYFKNSWDDFSSEFYEVASDWIAKIFDFDQAYLRGTQNLGLTNTALCKQHGICNIFNKKWDLFRFLKSFYSTLRWAVKRNIAKPKENWNIEFLKLGERRKWFNAEFFIQFDKIPEVDVTKLISLDDQEEDLQGVKDSKFASLPMFLHSFDQVFATSKRPENFYGIKPSQ